MLSVLRKHRRLALAVSVVVLLSAGLGIVVASTGEHHTAGPPVASPSPRAPEAGAGVDLAGWKLSIPEENDDGDATSIEPATTKAALAKYGPRRWADVLGAQPPGPTTKNSEHPPHRVAKPHQLPRR